ncbi:recombinase family protein [Haloferax volcanii]|uniref:recombinase family protein n=1 Tax=Haloferax volcanii TaxID=2246 RepID=UPI003854B38D
MTLAVLIAVWFYPTLYNVRRIWHRGLKKGRIRSGYPHRIQPLILVWGQRLYRQTGPAGCLSWLLRLRLFFSSVTKQSDITKFGDVTPKSLDADSKHDWWDEEDQSDEAEDTGIIYARVSSQKQAREGYGLETQVDQLKRIAKNEGIPLHCEPIQDRAQTGGSFERDGIQRVFREAQKDGPSYLLVQDVDRIGRAAAETLYFIYILQTECDVTLITQSGQKDVSSTRGLMQTTLMSLMAQLNNEFRIRKSKESMARSFIEKKNWKADNPIVPLGYEQTDDGWIQKNMEKAPVVQDLFEEFVDCEVYQETKRRIEEDHGDVLDGHRVKTLLQESAYKGKPQLSANTAIDYEGGRVMNEPELQIVDERTFSEAQRIIEKKNEKYASDNVKGLVDFIEEFDLFTVVESSSPVELRCESCHGSMMKNGQRSLTGAPIKVHMYRCTECGKSRKWPRDSDYGHMEFLQKLPDFWELWDRVKN